MAEFQTNETTLEYDNLPFPRILEMNNSLGPTPQKSFLRILKSFECLKYEGTGRTSWQSRAKDFAFQCRGYGFDPWLRS